MPARRPCPRAAPGSAAHALLRAQRVPAAGILSNKQEQRLAITIDADDVDFDMLVTFRTAGGIAQM
jgi:hypothetical protein